MKRKKVSLWEVSYSDGTHAIFSIKKFALKARWDEIEKVRRLTVLLGERIKITAVKGRVK